MMLALTLTALLTLAATATGLSLLDSWIRGRGAYDVVRHQRALLDAGFVPQVDASEVRLRGGMQEAAFSRAQTVRSTARQSVAPATRGRERAIPLPDCA